MNHRHNQQPIGLATKHSTTGYCLMILLASLVIIGNDFRHNQVSGSSNLDSSPQDNLKNPIAQQVTQQASKTAATLEQDKKSEAVIQNETKLSSPEEASQLQTRQARADSSETSGVSASVAEKESGSSGDPKKSSEPPKKDAAPVAATPASSAPTKKPPSSNRPAPNKPSAAKTSSTSSSNGKPRLQANLGSTILQGSVSQMSKHDAYSAIAEKHGALAQDAMRRSDKRRIGNGGGFGPAGIQKASGLGDIFNPVKMSDTGLARSEYLYNQSSS